MATATEALAGLQTIPLDRITPNPFNPRKHFEKGPLQELAESIKVHGVRQPVLVRPLGKNYQLVVGERRWRASKLAGKGDIPAIVDPQLDDRSALEIMVIENLQREDVHPLDEALGYQVLMEQHCSKCGSKAGHKIDCPNVNEAQSDITAESIAAKVGKSVGYVYARLKLLALVPVSREAFQAGHISAGHAVLIARLQPIDQAKALGHCFKNYVTGDEEKQLKQLDLAKATFLDLADVLGLAIDKESDDLRVTSEKSLREWIQDNVNLRLKDVPWDLADAKLLPEAGACSTCQKRSASNPALFAELAVKSEDTCFDPGCYGRKREAFVKIEIKKDKARAKEANAATAFPHGEQGVVPSPPIRQISEQASYLRPSPDQRVLKAGQWLPAKKAECPSVEEAIIVNGSNAGVRKLVCCNGVCKVHKHHFQAPMSSSSSSPSEGPAAKAKRELERKVQELMVHRVRVAAVAKITKPTTEILAAIIEQYRSSMFDDCSAELRVLGIECKDYSDCNAKAASFMKKAGIKEMLQFLWLLVSGEAAHLYSAEFKALAKRNKIDLAKLRKQLEKELTPPPVQTSTKAKAAAKGK